VKQDETTVGALALALLMTLANGEHWWYDTACVGCGETSSDPKECRPGCVARAIDALVAVVRK
jgi:hypothetical protein